MRLVLAMSAVLALPAGAMAATARYAAPKAQGTGDCSAPADACPLATAVTVAASGDTINVLGNLGVYHLASHGVSPGSKVLHFVGQNGTPRLVATSSAPVLELTAPSSSATGLYLVNNGDGDGLFVSPTSGGERITIDRVFVKTTGDMTSHTCFLGGQSTLTNSVCWQANSMGFGGAVTTEFLATTLRNDTAWQSGGGSAVQCAAVYGDCSLTVLNTIARATGTGGSDLGAFSTGAFDATVTAHHSNFATAAAQGSGTSMDHISVDATDQSAMPKLVNPVAGNFRELSTSPTINAGVTNAANGVLDLAGRPRTVNGKTDIGAYELGTPLRPPHDTRITRAKINRLKHGARFTFTASGIVRGFQCALIKQAAGRFPKPHFARCRSPRTYSQLKRGNYIFEVRAVNSAGPDRSPAKKRFGL